MRFLKRFKWNKRKILTVTTVLLVFVMSLGYAALSQYMDIDGVAMIDRSWIVKVTNVESSVTGEGVNNSSSYASTTVTMNATLPTSTSTVTYTITLENQGNLVAKLSSIDKIEDENTSIAYEISGVTVEETLLKPGETNTATVTIKYPSGTTSVSNIEKSLMLTFNYVEDSSQSITGGNNNVPLGNNNTVYKVGDKVTLLNGQEGYIVQDSGKENEMVSVFLPEQIANMPYDTNGSTDYNPGSTANIAYYMNTTYVPTIKSSLIESGGNGTGLAARLITQSEIGELILKDIIPTQPTWTMSSASDTEIYTYTGTKTLSKLDPTSSYNVAPVVVMLKSNCNLVQPKHLAEKILGENNSNVVTTGDGLYVSTATNDGSPTYYYKGNVTNNYVDFAGLTWRVVRINEDGTIKLILDDRINNTEYQFNPNYNNYKYMYYSESDVTKGIKNTIDNWYNNTLKTNYDSYIATTNFCESAKVKYSESSTSGNATMELSSNYTPNYKCELDGNNKQYVTEKAGLITVDEATMAGIPLYTGSQTNNTNTYLQESYYWWTMSPAGFYDYDGARAWFVSTYGDVDYLSNVGKNRFGVRPVISLNADTLVTGSGTESDKWVVSGIDNSLKTAILGANESNVVSSGDGLYVSTATNDGRPTYYYKGNVTNNYVSFANLTWRVVRINEDGTIKLILNDGINNNSFYIFNPNYNNYKYMYYSESNVTNGIKNIVDNWYTNTLKSNYDNKIVESNFCESAKVKPFDSNTSGSAVMQLSSSYAPNFKCTLDGNGKQYVNAKVGLITVDEEAMAGESLEIYASAADTYLLGDNAYWTMSPAGFDEWDEAKAWLVWGYTSVNRTSDIVIRPVINLKADTKISGSGTSTDMWVVQ